MHKSPAHRRVGGGGGVHRGLRLARMLVRALDTGISAFVWSSAVLLFLLETWQPRRSRRSDGILHMRLSEPSFERLAAAVEKKIGSGMNAMRDSGSARIPDAKQAGQVLSESEFEDLAATVERQLVEARKGN